MQVLATLLVKLGILSTILNLFQEGIARVKMFMVITVAYLVFWGPLFLVTLFR